MSVFFSSKILSRNEVIGLCDAARTAGKKVGYTSGVFDILHPGHVQYLEDARKLVDVLIVGVNADSSVRANKGPRRPINSQEDRAAVVAGLGSVSHVFIFDEQNNNENVVLLRPDVYVKAGDYAPEALSSKPLVEKSGGRVEIVPMQGELSTTGIINRIEDAFRTVEGQTVTYGKRPAIFVDRDGTINEHVEYLSEPSKFREIPGSLEALRMLKAAGYRIVVVTNQPGIGLGYFAREDLFAVNREMLRQATKVGLAIDRIFFCPHSKADGCRCRKPGTLLIERAVIDLNIDLPRSFMIGDMTSDIQLGKNVGCTSVLVATGKGGHDEICEVVPDIIAENLLEAAKVILSKGALNVVEGPAITVAPMLDPSERRVLEAVGRFGGDVGHDFSNILGSALACIDLIRQRSPAASAEEGIEDILVILEKAVTKGISLSNRIRGFLRAGSNPQEGVSLKICVKAVFDLLSSSKRVSCNFELTAREDLLVAVADFTVTQILLQLFENSIEAMQGLADKFIVVNIEKVELSEANTTIGLGAGIYAKLGIADHGRGIEPQRQEAVFHPFSSSKSRTVGKGLGLSMAMANAVMKQHGGALTLASTKNIGTTICLFFPLHADAPS